MSTLNRRDFVKASAVGLAVLASGKLGWPSPAGARVSLVSASAGGRDAAIRKAIDLIGAPNLKGKTIALKPNFNSADPYPGSTHPDTLNTLVRVIHELGTNGIVVADRSGMGDTRQVMETKGIFDLAKSLRFEARPLQGLPAEDWIPVHHGDLHWSQGYHLARVFRDADAVVQTCCLKTHRFGGHFTLSLKNSVGMVAKQVPGIDNDFMRELHGSRDHQRRMIAEINLSYRPALIVMDAIECFTDQGPDKGPTARPNVVLASTDRVALDAVGVAILREKGTTSENVSKGKIFNLEQIARAVELGIGVDLPDRIEILTAEAESERYAEKLRGILLQP
jgi:uncharacterized protein (DUF362 family)